MTKDGGTAPRKAAKPFAEHIQRIEKSIQERNEKRVYQLSLWSDVQRGVPNEFVRSALFPAIPANKARYLQREVLFSQEGFRIEFTGRQLTQSDLDVFEGIMHLGRGVREGNYVEFTAHGLLKLIGRDTGKSQHEWLLNVLQRLTATSLMITRDGSKVYWGSLLPEGAANFESGRYRVELRREMLQLFSRGFTLIEWDQRRSLGKKPLAQALHGWICSHSPHPYPVTVRYLHDLTGSNTKDLKHFRANLRVALPEIQASGAIKSWRIDTRDKVHIERA
ncbi:MAG: plasmid replication initiator TrfA [Nitrosospira sp.]